ncbi:hypothetical protein J132_04347 [Termitomyces sp. J132]|nr:hypothetical protein J132_04347 [Termitomyces sp. J132]
MSTIIRLGPKETGMVSLYSLLEATQDFTGKPTPISYAQSTSTRDVKFYDKPPAPLLESVVPVPELVEDLRKVIKPQLKEILVPANSQFVAIVHPASTTLPFKRHHYLEKDNESQFEQENLAPVFKIMAYHMAYDQIRKETRRNPEYAAVFERWSSPNFQKSSFHFFASSTQSKNNITDFAIFSSLLPPNCTQSKLAPYETSFDVKAVVEVKTTRVLTDAVFQEVTGWYTSGHDEYSDFVLGKAIQYVWPDEAPNDLNNKAGGAGAGSGKEQTLDKVLRQIWGQMIEENVEYAVLTSATSSYYFFRRRDGSGDLFISPPYRTADNVALYAWLSAALGVNGVDTDKINTPPVDKVWWNSLPTFEATGIRPA